MSDYNQTPAGLHDLLYIAPEFRWSRFDRFMWHAEHFAIGLARIFVIGALVYLVAR